ncbi:MAG: hypothetical protein OEY58_11805 [Gammaproteobacteria bacterium]|nr:hypothetical protein [Gammaproteobacteria bacterium]
MSDSKSHAAYTDAKSGLNGFESNVQFKSLEEKENISKLVQDEEVDSGPLSNFIYGLIIFALVYGAVVYLQKTFFEEPEQSGSHPVGGLADNPVRPSGQTPVPQIDQIALNLIRTKDWDVQKLYFFRRTWLSLKPAQQAALSQSAWIADLESALEEQMGRPSLVEVFTDEKVILKQNAMVDIKTLIDRSKQMHLTGVDPNIQRPAVAPVTQKSPAGLAAETKPVPDFNDGLVAKLDQLVEEQTKLEREEQAQQERESQAQREREELAQREREAQAQREREELAQREQEAQAQREREELAQREREAQAQREREELAQREREAQAQREREELAQREREAQAQREREELARIEREEQARREREAQAQREREENIRREREAIAQREREEKARREREEKMALQLAAEAAAKAQLENEGPGLENMQVVSSENFSVDRSSGKIVSVKTKVRKPTQEPTKPKPVKPKESKPAFVAKADTGVSTKQLASKKPLYSTIKSQSTELGNAGVQKKYYYVNGVTEFSKRSKKTPTIAELNNLTVQLISAYEAGDLERFTSLFDDDPESEYYEQLEQVKSEYQDLVYQTSDRQMFIRDMKWTFKDNVAIGKGTLTLVTLFSSQSQILNRKKVLEMVARKVENKILITRFE